MIWNLELTLKMKLSKVLFNKNNFKFIKKPTPMGRFFCELKKICNFLGVFLLTKKNIKNLISFTIKNKDLENYIYINLG